MSTRGRHVSAKAVLAAKTGLVLAGCATSAGTSTSAATSASAPATASSAARSSGTATPGSVVPPTALPFPVAVGSTWVYASTVPSLEATGTVTNKVLSVVPVTGGNRVTESYTTSASSSTADSSYIFHSDGSITIPLSQVSGGTVVTTNGGVLLPPAAAIASGRPYRSVLTLGFREHGRQMTETAHVTVRGEGTATVTVPAGVYRATVVDMTMSWSAGPLTVIIDITTWVARGTGTVKSEATLRNGGTIAPQFVELLSTEELESFTRG